MNKRFVVVTAVLACTAAELRGQEGSLVAFGSDREIARFLRTLPEPPPEPAPPAPPPMPQPAAVIQPLAPGSHDGPVEQWPAVVTGRIANAQGQPEAAVLVRIEALNVGASTAADGTYRILIPHDRIQPGQPVTVTAARTGLAPVSRTLAPQPGTQATLDFRVAAAVLLLEDIVVTGVGSESITNTQHAGVDEGGIVKVHGDYLVVLRRGRLFTVDVGGGRLQPVDAVDAFAPGAEPAWYYDEMLVSGENVVVIGYGDAGTELSLFRIDARGRLRHRSTYHMRSNDYYSSENYASRLLGNRLVLYTPVPADRYGGRPADWVPGLRRWRPGVDEDDEGGFRRILPYARVYRPGRPMDAGRPAMLHTVTTCEIARGELDCESSAVLGPPGRVFYVSPRAVYVWVSDWMRPSGRARAGSMLYRLPLDGGAPAALGVEGSPVDQFSFLDSGDGHLNVVVREDGTGDGMWGAERSGGTVRLLRVALSRLGDGRADAPRAAYRDVPQVDDEHGSFTNRFVGAHLLYGDGSGWGPPRAGGSTLVAVRWRDGRATRLRLPHAVDRIEAMGGDAVVVGADEEDLHFTGISLDGEPAVGQRYVQRGASQGETRSHGFFYRQDGPDEGVIGLPVAGAARPGYEHLFEESAGVLFLRNEDRRFRPLGELFAHVKTVDDDRDACVTSCADWYGNSRPIFLRGRVFALLGYEIVEGQVVDGRIREVARASFAPRSRSASAQ
jgi:hypothetical protein